MGRLIDEPIEKLELPLGILNKLQVYGMTKIEDIVVLCEREVFAIKGIGAKSFRLIRESINEIGFALAEDPYFPNLCARHNQQRNDASIKTFFLCEKCANDFQNFAFNTTPPIFTQKIAIGPYYCTHCNEKRQLTMYQWLLCDVCERVVRSLGRGVAANKGVMTWWEEQRRLDSTLPTIKDTDPPILRPRAEHTMNPQLDFTWYDSNGEILFGAEIKTGRNYLSGGSIRSGMTQFQLDVSDIQSVISEMKRSNGFTPAYLFHCQVVDIAQPPTMKLECVGIWWTSIRDLIKSINEIKQRPRENRPAAYIDIQCFKDSDSFIDEVKAHGYKSCLSPSRLQKQIDALL